MLRVMLLGGAAVMTASVGSAHAGGDPGYLRRGPRLPPDIAYRDPSYLPPPPRPVLLAPVVLVPRSLSVPLYNEPPPRFPNP